MFNVNDLKNGMTIEFDNNIYQVLEFQHVKPGKGNAFVRSKLKNLRTGSTIDHTFNSGIKIGKANVEKRKMQFLYMDNNKYIFMNLESYEQIELLKKQIEDESKYLTEGLEVDLIFYEGELLGVILPEKVEMKIASTEPGVKGNTANNALKDAILESGVEVKVPLFVNDGETIIISTKDGKYVGRK